jgi:hypothetical protein
MQKGKFIYTGILNITMHFFGPKLIGLKILSTDSLLITGSYGASSHPLFFHSHSSTTRLPIHCQSTTGRMGNSGDFPTSFFSDLTTFTQEKIEFFLFFADLLLSPFWAGGNSPFSTSNNFAGWTGTRCKWPRE